MVFFLPRLLTYYVDNFVNLIMQQNLFGYQASCFSKTSLVLSCRSTISIHDLYLYLCTLMYLASFMKITAYFTSWLLLSKLIWWVMSPWQQTCSSMLSHQWDTGPGAVPASAEGVKGLISVSYSVPELLSLISWLKKNAPLWPTPWLR